MRVFDAHLHIIDPRFPPPGDRGYVPAPFTCDDYLAAVEPLDVRGGAVVSGSFHGDDQSSLLAALDRLGPGFVGVTQLAPDVPDGRIRALDAAGVRAVRFNLRRSGPAGADDLVALGRRVAAVAGWHVEVYVDARHLPGLAPALAELLPRVVIDHLGLSAAGLEHLLGLVERGATVKASGFGRGDLDVPAALRAVTAVDPSALVFGTDLPSTRAPRPFHPDDLALVVDTLGQELAGRVLWDNAVALYRPAGA